MLPYTTIQSNLFTTSPLVPHFTYHYNQFAVSTNNFCVWTRLCPQDMLLGSDSPCKPHCCEEVWLYCDFSWGLYLHFFAFASIFQIIAVWNSSQMACQYVNVKIVKLRVGNVCLWTELWNFIPPNYSSCVQYSIIIRTYIVNFYLNHYWFSVSVHMHCRYVPWLTYVCQHVCVVLFTL